MQNSMQREASTVIRRADSLQKQCTELERELDERTKALAEYRGQVRTSGTGNAYLLASARS